jgi:hypothetical protein
MQIKVLGISCLLTGTDDYHYTDCPTCNSCNWKETCQSKFDEDELSKAYEAWVEGQKLMQEAETVIEYARQIFSKQMNINKLTGYQVNNLKLNNVYYGASVTYPKAKLLKVFSPEQLEPCAEHKEARWVLTVVDLLKERKKKEA